MRRLLSHLVLWSSLTSLPGLAQQPRLDCSSGPLTRTYGATPWLVYGCSDGKSVVVVTDGASRAAPFYFMFFPKDGKYQLVGEGTGSKPLTDRAHAELVRLTEQDIAQLVSEARKVSASKPAK